MLIQLRPVASQVLWHGYKYYETGWVAAWLGSASLNLNSIILINLQRGEP